MSSVYIAPGPGWPSRLFYGMWTFGALLLAGAAIVIPSRSLFVSIAADKATAWEFLATLAAFAFASLAIWSAWWCRIGVFPFRFIADPSTKECGYRWGFWWANRKDLSDAEQLRGEVMHVVTRSGRGSWRWKIDALRSEERDVAHLFSPFRTFDSKDQAETDCKMNLEALAECLELPSEIIMPPEPKQNEQGAGGIGGQAAPKKVVK